MNSTLKTGIIGGGLGPHLNEAMANQVFLLSKNIGAQVITTNDLGLWPFKRYFEGRYLILNSKFLMRKTPLLSQLNGFLIFIAIKYFEHKFDQLIIPGGINSIFLTYLNNAKCVPIITSLPTLTENDRVAIKQQLSKVLEIIVQSKKTKKQLLEIGVDEKKIQILLPLVDYSRFHYAPPNESDIFTILFASAPTIEIPNEDNFSDKGIPILLEAFKNLSKNPDFKCKLILIWRNTYYQRLQECLKNLQLTENVEIVNSVVDMESYYHRSDVTIIPYTTLHRSPEIPLSALESIACGRPVITTNVGEISDIVKENTWGVVSKPDAVSLYVAMIDSKEKYYVYQRNCFYSKNPLTDLNFLEIQ